MKYEPYKTRSLLSLCVSLGFSGALALPSMIFADTPPAPSAPVYPDYTNQLNNISTADQSTNTNTSSMKADLDQINTNTSMMSSSLIYSPSGNANTAGNQLYQIQNDLNFTSPDLLTMAAVLGLGKIIPNSNPNAPSALAPFGSDFWSASFDQMSIANPLPAYTPTPAASGATTPAYTDWLLQWWEGICGDANNPLSGNPLTANGYTTTSPGSLGGDGGVSPDAPQPYIFSAICEEVVSQANANNIIPLVMPASNIIYTASSVNENLTPIQASNQSLSAGIQQLTPVVATTTSSAAQSYIDQLTATPPIAEGAPSLPNSAAEMTLISGVLQAVSQDYQSGKMAEIDQVVSEENAPVTPGASYNPWQVKVASANVSDLLRMLLLEVAKSNQIQVMQLEQSQRNNVLSAAILADLVKLNQGNAVLNTGITATTAVVTQNGLISSHILNTLMRTSGQGR